MDNKSESLTRWLALGMAALGTYLLLSKPVAAAPTTPISPSSIYYGVYTGSISSGLPAPAVELAQFETDAGKKVSIVGMLTWWYDTFTWGDFNTQFLTWANNVRNHGSIPLIVWQPFNPLRCDNTKNCAIRITDPDCCVIKATDSDYPIQMKNYSLSRIASGYFDNYIHTWATQIKEWGYPLMMRPMHELNCSGTIASTAYGQSWCAGLIDNNGSVINTPADAAAAWKHIVDIFTSEGANNVTWVWSVLSWPSSAYGGTNPISLSSIYPGDNYVDWIGIECYNANFMPLAQACNDITIQGIYQEVVALSPTKYILMAEMGAIEDTSNPNAKPEWISNALSFDVAQSIPYMYPRIKAIFYWNSQSDMNLSIESSNLSTNAFKESIANDQYGTNNYSKLTNSPIIPP